MYYALDKVACENDCELLYCDTDSIMYKHPENFDPLPAGKGHLGELTNETPDHSIETFISGGCKNYVLKLKRNDGTGNDFIMKIRGFPNNTSSNQVLTYKKIKKLVLSYKTKRQFNPIIVSYPNTLRPNIRKGSVYTIPSSKSYQVVVTKGIIDDNTLNVLPFGFRK